MPDSRPLSALLSQALVALTVELDNELERRVGLAGHPGARLSLAVWFNVMRFVPESGVLLRELAAQGLMPMEAARATVGCLERWRFVDVGRGPATARREGWGSGRGLRVGDPIRPAGLGRLARHLWPPLPALIEARWRERFGAEAIASLRADLLVLAERCPLALPDGLPGGWLEMTEMVFPPREGPVPPDLPLPALLARVLLAFALELNARAPVPLALAANVLRVVGPEGVPLAELPRLTGSSPERVAIGWQLRPFVTVSTDGGSRTKIVRLTAKGVQAQRAYLKGVRLLEARWAADCGDAVAQARAALEGLFALRGGAPAIAAGLVPPPGVLRAGDQAPALGRRAVAAAARQRARDLVAQTEAYVRDPAAALPHYPLWDFNRGYGP